MKRLNIAERVGVRTDSLMLVLKRGRIFVLKVERAKAWTLALGSWESDVKLSKTLGRYLEWEIFSGEASRMRRSSEIAAMRACQSLDWSRRMKIGSRDSSSG